ncbi:MAG: PspA/IM30 family protein [Myxococcales bacterium]|nr:PspA/IM30 family protein [Myxococcales bacterium]
MGFFSRLAEVIKSNLNDLINRAEDPEKMLDQVVVDMRAQLVEAKKQVAVAIADEKKLERQAQKEAAVAAEWEKKAMLAVRAGDDDLAKQALSRQRQLQEVADQYQAQWEKQKHAVEQLKTALRALNSKIEEANRKKGVLIARKRRADAMKSIEETMAGMKEASAFETFERLERKVEQVEAEADAQSELNKEMGGDVLKQRFQDLEADAGTDEALLALKQKMGVAPAAPAVAARVETSAAGDEEAELAELEQALAELKAREGAE